MAVIQATAVKKKTAGFTIVELLIVVVIIAILAAITIVSYNGITQRANNSAALTVVDNWEKAIRLAVVDGVTIQTGSCLGKTTDFAAANGFGQGECMRQYDGAGTNLVATTSYNAAFFAGWPSTSRPSGEMQISQYNGDGFMMKSRGIWILNVESDQRTVWLGWIAQRRNQCGRGVMLYEGASNGVCALEIKY